MVTITAECDSFLYHMMRLISGTLVKLGLGQLNEDDLRALLALRGRNPRKGGLTAYKAPARGLCLHECFYCPSDVSRVYAS